MAEECLECLSSVFPKQDALQCDGCSRWQHRTCGTGVTRDEYKMAVREGLIIDWMCYLCNAKNIKLEETEEEDCDVAADDFCPPTEDDDDVVSYEKVPSSSQRGHPKLIDGRGYAYTVKRKTHAAVHWRCVVRNKVANCKTTVKEEGGRFVRGPNPHCHPPDPCPSVASRLSTLVKRRAVEDVLRPAAEIVEEVLRDEVGPDTPRTSLPAPINLARQINRKRRALTSK